MDISSTQFKLIRKEKDPKFNIDHLEHYNLLLQVGFSDMQVCIVDSRNNKVMLMEDYGMPGVTSQNERVECLECLFDDHHLLLAGFWNRVKVLVKNKKFSLVPRKLFSPENQEDYIRLNTPVDSLKESYFHNEYYSLGLVNTFAINSNVVDFLVSKTYPAKQVCFYHQSSAFIKGYERYFADDHRDIMALYLDRFVLHIAVFRDGDFKFYNQFPVKKFDDYFRFINFVLADASMTREKTKFFVWGYLGKNSNHFQQLKSGYPSLEYGERPPGLKLSYVFDAIPEHQYFDLLSFNFLD